MLADPLGRLIWASPALPGAVHDLRAARTLGIITALAISGARVWADKGYQGAGGSVIVPYCGRWRTLSEGKRAVNRSHAKIRAVWEQTDAVLKTWRLLRKLTLLAQPNHAPRPNRAQPSPDAITVRLEKAHWLIHKL